VTGVQTCALPICRGNIGASANGYELAPGEAISFDVSNTNALYVDAAHAGDAVTYLWVTA